MLVKNYDIYQLRFNEFSRIDIDCIRESEQLFYLRIFFLWAFGRVRHNIPKFIKEIENYPYDRFLFEEIEVNFDQKNNLIYLTEGWYEYHNKLMRPEVQDLYNKDKYIELCKIGFFDYMTIDKDNFIHLIMAWDKILYQLSPFILLYQNDQDWYDLLPFDSKEAMDKFVADHTK